MTRAQRQSKAWYNMLSRYYDVLFEPFHSHPRRRGIEMLAVSPGESVLVVGCGTGRGVSTLETESGNSGRVVGIDVAEQMCQRTRRRVDSDTSSGVVCGDTQALPFGACTFDAVLVSFTLELFEEDHRRLVLDEIRRVLATQGRLCVVAPTTATSAVVAPLYERLNDIVPTLVDSRPFDVSDSLERRGFELLARDIEWAPVVPVELAVGRVQESSEAHG